MNVGALEVYRLVRLGLELNHERRLGTGSFRNRAGDYCATGACARVLGMELSFCDPGSGPPPEDFFQFTRDAGKYIAARSPFPISEDEEHQQFLRCAVAAWQEIIDHNNMFVGTPANRYTSMVEFVNTQLLAHRQTERNLHGVKDLPSHASQSSQEARLQEAHLQEASV